LPGDPESFELRSQHTQWPREFPIITAADEENHESQPDIAEFPLEPEEGKFDRSGIRILILIVATAVVRPVTPHVV
jgi:hypothetical protein